MTTKFAALAAANPSAAAAARPWPRGILTEVTFGTNWVAQAEHGGYYRTVWTGTYEACGLNVNDPAGAARR